MKLDEMLDLTADRMPTTSEVVAFVYDSGWSIDTSDAKRPRVDGASDEDRPIAEVTDSILRREPYRTETRGAVIEKVLGDLERAVDEWRLEQQESRPADRVSLVVTPAMEVEVGPTVCQECRALVYGSTEDPFRCCDRTPCPFAPNETWWKRSRRK